MSNKDIEKGLVKERKYLLPLNKIISNKKALAVICALISVAVVLLCNYLWNCLMQFGNIIRNIGNLQVYLTLKNMFVFNIKDYWGFYLVLAIAVVIINARFIFLVNVNIKDQNVGQKDNQRWTTIEEIQEQYPSMNERGGKIEKGGLPVCMYRGKVYIDSSPVNNLILGMTRAGKGESIIILMIWLYCNAKNKASLIINDAKQELLTMCEGALTKSGYRVLVYNIHKPLNGFGYNPLDLIIRAWKKKEYSDAEMLALSIAETIYKPSEAEGEAKYWASSAASLFCAMIIAVTCDCIEADRKINSRNLLEWRRRQKAFELLSDDEKTAAREEFKNTAEEDKLSLPYIPLENEYIPTTENEEHINLYSVAKVFMDLASCSVGPQGSGKTALDIYFEERPANDRARMKFFSTEVAPDRTASSIYSSMFDALTVFTFEDVAKMTSKSTIDLYDIGFGDEPLAIFLFTPDWDKSKHFLTNIFLDQVYFALSSKATEMPRKKCDRDVMHILDEFGSINPIDNISNKVSAGAGKGILYTFIIQSYEQLKPYKDQAGTIKDNCSNHVYILSADKTTREEFSADVGNETATNVHRNGKYLSLDKTFMEIYEERPLITANKLGNLTEGENVIVRYTKRRDNEGNKIRANPIINTGETAFKYRYEYLEDIFPSDVLLSSITINNPCRKNVDLSDLAIDINEDIFKDKLAKEQARETGQVFIPTNDSIETIQLVRELKQANILLEQLSKLAPDRNCNNMTVSEAVTVFETARQLSKISKAERDSLIDLMMINSIQER